MTTPGMTYLIHKIASDINSISTAQQPINLINLPEKQPKQPISSPRKILSPRKMKRDTSMTNFMKYSWSWSI